MTTPGKRLAIACAGLALLFACGAKLAQLDPPNRRSHFVLQHDVYQQSVRGLMKYRWIHGLRKGTYRLVAQDPRGGYYQGEGDAVFLLSQQRVDRYLQDGFIPTYLERYRLQAASAGGHGGVWIPKDPRKDTPRIYYILYTSRAASIEHGLATPQDTPAPADAGASQPPLTQLVGAALVSALNGKIETEPLDAAAIDPALFQIVDDDAAPDAAKPDAPR